MLNPRENDVRPMRYRPLGPGPLTGMDSPERLANRVRELEIALEEKEQQLSQKLESVRQGALREGRQQAGTEQGSWRAECIGQLQGAIEEFRMQRDGYMARVEHEVVRLALGIAERILHREAQMDPMLLSGAVRVALGQLAESTEVRLRVPADQKEMWAEMVRLMPGLPLRPEVQGDEGMREAEAMLETSLGTVDLGVKAQLGEIERSFFESAGGAADGTGRASPPEAEGK